jgi:myo-inositol 2-dehydrogenase/D-chiro-inositol 1-dehydrogenase
MRIGLVGVGRIGAFHASTFSQLPQVDTVICEKPVAPDVDGTVAVIKRTTGSAVPVQVGFQRRFDVGSGAARQAARSGSLGWVHTVRATTLDAAPPRPEYRPGSGGFFRDCAVHDFDAIRWVTGHEVMEVYAVGVNRGAEFFQAAGDVDTLSAMLTQDALEASYIAEACEVSRQRHAPVRMAEVRR